MADEKDNGRHSLLKPLRDGFHKFASHASNAVGSTWAFGAAAGLVVLWAFSYPLFKDFDTWQLVINTATTIVTFLIVFLIQNTQNRDGRAIQLKLDELIRAIHGARSKLMDLEECTDEELDALQREFRRLREHRSSSPGKKDDDEPSGELDSAARRKENGRHESRQ
jgi:low affinity Fe/Cu permease